MKIHNKIKLQHVAISDSADIDYKDFMNICRKFISKPHSFLTIETTLPADNLVRFRKNILGSL